MYMSETNHWPAAHRSDAGGSIRPRTRETARWHRNHAVGDEVVKVIDIARAIGEELSVPTGKIEHRLAMKGFGVCWGFGRDGRSGE